MILIVKGEGDTAFLCLRKAGSEDVGRKMEKINNRC